MKEEVEETIRSLPTGKSPGSDDIPAELIKKGGNKLVTVMIAICQTVW